MVALGKDLNKHQAVKEWAVMSRMKQVWMTALVGTVVAGASGCNVDGRWGHARELRGAVSADGTIRSHSGNGAGIDIAIADAREVDLVEELIAHRNDYDRSLRRLHAYYGARGYVRKADWAAFEIKGFRNIKQFRYLLDAEVASDSLRAAESIPEADSLFAQAQKLMRSGGHGVPALYREDRMVQAANTFRRLIEQHPSSDKIDDAAFFLGEIHKEYLPNQEEIAVTWYERAWTWNPRTQHPARFHAAVVYDYRLHDRDRALELYRRVTNNESASAANARSAERRIEELTGSARVAKP